MFTTRKSVNFLLFVFNVRIIMCMCVYKHFVCIFFKWIEIKSVLKSCIYRKLFNESVLKKNMLCRVCYEAGLVRGMKSKLVYLIRK